MGAYRSRSVIDLKKNLMRFRLTITVSRGRLTFRLVPPY